MTIIVADQQSANDNKGINRMGRYVTRTLKTYDGYNVCSTDLQQSIHTYTTMGNCIIEA